MEKMGVPSVPIITKAYLDLAKSTAAQRGMPTLRIAYTVHPIWGLTGDQVRAFLDTNDPVSNQPFMKEVIAGLTSPLTAEDEKTGLQPVSPGPATFGPDTLDNLQAYFMNNQMTNYMPIVVPAEAKVAQMLKGTSHKPDEVVGRAGRTANGAYEYTVKQVAVNAVMAGCDPSCFPIVLALAASGELALGGSTTSFGYAMVINGPIRDKLNMNYGIGALSGFAQPNATIGRAWSLLGKNLGAGSIPGQTYMGSQGNNLNYNNLVIAENEGASPWVPFHVQKGFKAEENVVSLFRGLGIVPGQGARGTSTDTPKYEEQFSDLFSVFTGFFGGLVVADPLIAVSLKARGYDTKEKLIDWLYKNTTQTVED